MATTEEALLDRLSGVCVEAGYVQAASGDFRLQPNGQIDGVFTMTLVGSRPIGGFNYSEECRAEVEIAVARPLNDDDFVARKALLADARALVNALVLDGAEDSGEYAVEDGGRTVAIEAPAGASYLVARIRVPINYEADLAA